jgi:hypothetical protein
METLRTDGRLSRAFFFDRQLPVVLLLFTLIRTIFTTLFPMVRFTQAGVYPLHKELFDPTRRPL